MAVTAVLIVLGVAAASMVFVLAGGALTHFMGVAESAAPKTNIEILAFGPHPVSANITIRNVGPEGLPLKGTNAWQVFIDGQVYSVSRITDANGINLPPSHTADVNEVFVLWLSSGVGDEPHDIAVYGPYGTRARAGYSP